MAAWAIGVMSAYGFEHLFRADARHWQGRWWRGTAMAALIAAGVLLVVLVRFVGVTKVLLVGPMRMTLDTASTSLGDPFFLVPLFLLGATLLLVVAMGWLPRRVAAGATVALLAVDLLVARPQFELRSYSPSSGWATCRPSRSAWTWPRRP
jgi:hypothetical protein